MSTSPLAEFAQRFGNALALEMKRMAEALGPLLDAVWAAYREAGAPYGESEEAMLKWLGERGQIVDLRAQADRLESIHETRAQLRPARRPPA